MYHYPIRTVALASALLVLGACSSPAVDTASGSPEPAAAAGPVTVLVHDSFALPEDLIASFEAESGLDVEFVAVGDAGTLVNQVSLTAGAPLGDAVYGIDNTFASRAVASGALADYVAPSAVDSYAGKLTAIDVADVCFNIDLAAFGDALAAPQSIADLTRPEYEGLVSLPSPTTSSTGLAFLLATYATYGEDWDDYWRALRDNGLKVTAGWSDSYFVDFSAPQYGGAYPIVLSYASSPPAEVIEGEPTTAALLDTCFRQTEYAGVLNGAAQPEAAQVVIEWMLSDAVQSALPDSMYVYPVSPTATVPASWQEFAPMPRAPLTLDPEVIDAERDGLLREWSAIVLDGK